jgi:hypothetical protein
MNTHEQGRKDERISTHLVNIWMVNFGKEQELFFFLKRHKPA